MGIGYRTLGLIALGTAALLAAGAFALHLERSGQRVPDEAEAAAIFTDLHRNIYRAFDHDDEGDIYDALSDSVDGRLLDRIYAEVYEALTMRDQGGALSKVHKVDILRSRVLDAPDAAGDRPTFRVRATWEVLSSLVHEGHEHVRLVEYEGVYAVAHREDGWRIVDDKILSQRPIPLLSMPDSSG
jgi:hypothetical protein